MKSFKKFLEDFQTTSIEQYSTSEFKWILSNNPNILNLLPDFLNDKEKWNENFIYFTFWKGFDIVGIAKTKVDISDLDSKYLKILYLNVTDKHRNKGFGLLILKQIFKFCQKNRYPISTINENCFEKYLNYFSKQLNVPVKQLNNQIS